MTQYYSRIIDHHDHQKLQNLLENCAGYYDLVYGLPVSPAEADKLFNTLPEGKSDDDKFLIGIFDPENNMTGVIEIIRDYPVENTWYINLMLMSPAARGRGNGRKIYDDTEEWAYDLGARIIRLSVAEQNERALKFWKMLGFKEISRSKEKQGNKENVVIVMNRAL
jgi:ribosomal protein S18 acetylase RimI-like enzyme